MKRTTLLLALCLSSVSGCLLDTDVDSDQEPIILDETCVLDNDGVEVCEGGCEEGACRVDSPPDDFDPDGITDTDTPIGEEDEPGLTPIAASILKGKELKTKCEKNPGKFPEYAGEVCTDRGGHGTWLMCHSRNATDRNYGPRCRSCRDNWEFVENQCKSISKDKPIDKITCLKDAMMAWIGNLEVCAEASRCLMRILDRIGYDCHREASDTHAWVVCSIDGVRHVFDGNNGMYYTCRPSR